MSKKLIELNNISKSFGNTLVLDELDLYIRENEFVTLLGPSGCGKTTTLRIIGGFETPDVGTVYFDESMLAAVTEKRWQKIAAALVLAPLSVLYLLAFVWRWQVW